MKKYIFIFLFFLSAKNFATHIVGGEMVYDYLGKNAIGQEQYRITLKIYRDCSGTTPFDGTSPDIPTIITIRETIGDILTGTINIGAPIVTLVPPTINNPCIKTPNDVCVEEGVYTTTLTLPAKTGGYYLTYQRCCRNGSITNLLAPLGQGATYYTKIPGPEEALINNSPRFKKFPPIYLCNDLDFTFDHSAIDPDGDRLEYSFYAPFLGGDQCCAAVGGPAGNCNPPCPAAAPALPYSPVDYADGYSGNYPVASGPSLNINPTTGQLKGRPSLIGQFVVGICVKEYRNGILINTHYRDFQFNIRPCVAEVNSNMKEQSIVCDGSTITFSNTSWATTGTPTAFWDFGVADLSTDTSYLFNPTYNFPDTGKHVVTLISDKFKPCADTIKRDFYVYPKLDIGYAPQVVQCLKTNSFNFSVTGTYSSGTSFSWDFTESATPSVSAVEDPVNIVYKLGGKFPVRLSAKYSICTDTFISVVKVIGIPLTKNWDTTVVVGEVVPLNAYWGYDYTYTWTPVIDYLNCSSCQMPDPISTTTSNITYTVLMTDSMACFTATRTFAIIVEPKATIDVPTAFTPNGDGVNDVIYADGWGIKKLFYFRVYNRWGQLLFETDDLKVGWNGVYKGVAQNMETYIYQVSAETYVDSKPISKQGSFRLIR